MVRINGKKFKIYELDDIYSFKSRLAGSMNTLESYLYFPDKVTETQLRNKKEEIIVEDLLAEIKYSATENESVVDLVKSIRSKVGKTKYDKGKDIVKLWLAYNRTLKENVEKQGKTPLDNIGQEIEKNKIFDFYGKNNIHSDWSNAKAFKISTNERIDANKRLAEKTLDLFGEYNSISESVGSTEFELEHVQFIITLEEKDMSLLEIFNTIHLNSTVPFCTTQNFYKILQDFTPPEEWTKSSDESIILQVSQKTFDFMSTNISNYENAIVKVDPLSKHITIEITVNNEKNNISKDVFTDRTLSVFNQLNTIVKQIDEKKVVGVFYYPLLSLNKYIFADLVMNDPIFSRLISIDDHDKATKMKPGIYIHFNHPLTGYITATLTEKTMIKGDPSMKNIDLDIFEPGTTFIRVKVSKANNEASVEMFKEILGKLFVRYDNKKLDVISYYKNYISDFGDISPPEIVDENVLKHSDVAPDLFVKNYTRNCKPDRMPTIVSEEEYIKAVGESRSVLKFPRDVPDDPDAFKFPMDGEGQNYYVCNNPVYKYVGIKNNKLKNADTYPYVPCCFKIDQTKKSKYLHYYEGKELVTGDKKQHNIIRTDKILKYDQFGTLPLNLENLFTIIDPDPKYEYVRKGVYNNKNSFINAVMEALNDETNILDVEGETEIENVLIDERLAFANKIIAPLCRQELYDRSVEEIIEMIENLDVYFDPRLFIHILEDRFDCNIFLFSRKYLDGEMILPRHVQAYHKHKNKKRCVYIYEHMGSESDHAKYPQCELIIKYDTKKSNDNVQYSFTYKESKNIRNMYERLRKAYAFNSVIKETYMPITSDIKIISQWIDSYGKTRRLNISFHEQKITLVTSPLQPIKVRETTSKKIYLTDVDTAMKLIENLGIEITSQTVIGNITKEINGTLGNVTVSIPLADTEDKLFEIPEKEYGISFSEQQESALKQYNTNKKLARYLVDYTIWMYSNYLNFNQLDVTNDNIAAFANEFFVIKPGYEYGHIEKTLTLDSPILDNGKIVVHNEETIKRLVYSLRLAAQTNLESVKRYHDRTVINKYYMDVTDFDKYNGQVILYGEESVTKWMFKNNVKYTLHDEVKIGVTTPYFFKNINIDNNVYLAQNTQSLEKASDIAVKWIRNGYNVGEYAESIPSISFNLYSYKNANNISKGVQVNGILKVNGKPFSNKVKILGYKIDNIPEYTVLLPLDEVQDQTDQLTQNDQLDKKDQLIKDTPSQLENKCTVQGLNYTGNSCYMDSVLLCLFAIPNKIITDNILNKNLDELKELEKFDVQCDSKDIETDIKRRKAIQTALNDITNSMRKLDNKIQKCSNLRYLLGKCILPQEFNKTLTQDAGEFVTYLFNLFQVEIMNQNKKFYGSNDTGENPGWTYVREQQSIHYPIITIPTSSIKQMPYNYDISSFVAENSEEIVSFTQPDVWKTDIGNFKLKKEVTTISSPFIIFRLERKDVMKILKNKVHIPEKIQSGKNTLHLSAMVVHDGIAHYTANFKCQDNWFFYDDNPVTNQHKIQYIGSYEKMLKNKENSPQTLGTLFFYTQSE